ncbi:MAG: PHP domain-containing protein [Bacteroidetes bacterium]|nr:PHP domain-containing protein [Rhodothermia bacterium]MCS7155031.1 PHP domain-containing protein [Bacteroidota bacterium]MCX7907315.1 PHP domain-containing protein [Bacteroidota bacterium]MDW8137958.1 PHP domain-containing protein [Bacteroidota bacterium]MDW8286190.1 PHP domain-containing protein [Bacteroidota bacterium]
MGLADLHIHTIYSLDGTSTVRAVLKRAAEVGLDVVAITDHDEIRASLEALSLAPAYGLQVVPGSEVSTAEGHLLALFVYRTPPAGLSLGDTVRWVRDEGGLCIIPHPGQSRYSVRFGTIQRVLQEPDVAPFIVGMEVFNSSANSQRQNEIAHATLQRMRWPLAPISSSDAHLLSLIGSAATYFPGRTAEELRQALLARSTRAEVMDFAPRPLFFLQWGAHLALRYAGWVSVNRAPEVPAKKAFLGLKGGFRLPVASNV